MKAGLVGFSQSGKSTLFNAITGLAATSHGKGKASLGAVKVPDPRVDTLAGICKPAKTTWAEVIFVDVPGPAAKSGGLDAAAVSALKEVDALVLVVGAFADRDPLRELVDFETELVLSDLGPVEKRLERAPREHTPAQEVELLKLCEQRLSRGDPLRTLPYDELQAQALARYGFLSTRPLLVVVNCDEASFNQPLPPALGEELSKRRLEHVQVCATLEAEVAALAPEERGPFLKELGVTEPASSQIIRAAYKALDYISYFTTGTDEVRAWTVRRGAKAPRAGGKIHSDIERGFIRAEVMAYDDFLAYQGSEARAREHGKLRSEGKEYVVHDGDCLHFKFAV